MTIDHVPAAVAPGRRRLVWTAVCTALLLSGCGALDGGDGQATAAAAPTSTASAGASSPASGSSAAAAASSALFDATSVQGIEVTFDAAAYDAMIETFSTTSEKEWIEAMVTINGQTFERAGLRLKGNSSLSSLRGGGSARGGLSGTVSAEDPAGLPWLVRLDKFVDDQSYQGVTELVVRSNSTETALNEAVALELLDAAGLATQQSTYARFSVNGGEAKLRLVVENPNDEWDAAAFASDGILYKAEAGGDYSYRGDDAEAYTDVFDQESGDTDDLTPLIEFLDFVNNSSDEEFAAQIDEHLDVESFARYLAIEDLMGNFDDIDGPGNNSYLRIATETGVATVVAWDHNLAFGTANIGGGGVGGRGGGGMPGGGAMPGGRAGGGGPGGSNILVSRFQAVPRLAALHEQATADLQAELYDSGLAAEILATRADVLRTQASDLVDEATVASEVDRLTAQLS